MYQVDKTSIEENKKKIDLHKRAFEYENKISFEIENRNDMTRINNNEVKNISECNLLHDMINSPKRAKKNSHYSPILHVCMNTIKGKVKFINFLTLLDSGCSSTIVMVRLVTKHFPEKDSPITVEHTS